MIKVFLEFFFLGLFQQIVKKREQNRNNKTWLKTEQKTCRFTVVNDCAYKNNYLPELWVVFKKHGDQHGRMRCKYLLICLIEPKHNRSQAFLKSTKLCLVKLHKNLLSISYPFVFIFQAELNFLSYEKARPLLD